MPTTDRPAPARSDRYLRVEQRVPGGDLQAWLKANRDVGATWREIADGLFTLYALRVSHETLRSWLDDDPARSSSTP